ncbi:Transthyretin-like family-containing protein [Strongyloides ratti]|uniref:Transthyretin-like family-containing protein n=1 Tax=Strongyloides ratti TaxID=34506 RepID=A0A090LK21_STRRB|nr:Transthyretin-like family-containing protein [Strongyloides ratti]CEF70137.1 Transthyretin-like family-containing protein [Strongyloides ratti]
MTYKIIIFLFVLSTSIVVKSCFFIGKTQSVKARGQVFCKTVPTANVIIKLVEKDYITRNDILSTTTSDVDGYFKLKGSCKQFSTIDPFLEIHHRCGLYPPNCHGVVTMEIPKNYITDASEATTWFDAGNIKLGPTARTFSRVICRR